MTDQRQSICRNCGKPEPDNRAGSMTSYFFQHKYCQCAQRRQRALRLSGRQTAAESNPTCLKCGKSRPEGQKAGSFTGFLFKELRCQCTNPKFAEDSSYPHNSGRTMTAERIKRKRQTAKSALDVSERTLQIERNSKAIVAGTIVGGTFKIESVIGEGGMGTVYLARHLTMQRQFALKVLAPALIDEQYWLRFQAEAKTLAALHHPNLVNVYDLGVHDKSVFYYSMDYLKGTNLEDVLARKGPLPLEEAIDIFLAVLDGLAYAHRHGIVHRDIKPANIFLCSSQNKETDSIKILDFGIAKLVDAGGSKQQMTAVGEIFGSPFYMSPEQCMGGKIDLRSDLYSVGCSLFETLSGFVPFEGKSALEIGMMHQEDDPPLLASVCSRRLPASVDQVIEKCMAKLPRDRYQSAKELALDLERIREGKNLSEYSKSGATQLKADADEEPSGLPWILAGLALILMGLSATVFWLLATPKPMAKVAPKMVADKSLPTMIIGTLNQPTDQSTHLKIKAFLESKPGFYSSTTEVDGKTQKVFNFPKGFSLGKIYFGRNGNVKRLEAQGMRRTEPGTVGLDGYTNLAEFPELLRYFRQDDLEHVFILSSEGKCDKIMAELVKFPTLQGISLAQIDFDNDALKPLEQMKHLITLSLLSEKLDLDLLSRNKVMRQIENFAFNTHKSVTPLLHALNPEKMHALEFKNAKLTKEDFITISSFKHLQALSLIDISITNADMEQLTALHDLKKLYLTDFKWNAKCVDILKKFEKLEKLTLPNEFINDRIIKMQIKLALPHLKLLVGHTRIELD